MSARYEGSPENILLICSSGDEKFTVNLWDAIERGMITFRPNGLNSYRVRDTVGDCPEAREDIRFVDVKDSAS